jgi:uncharacterized protein
MIAIITKTLKERITVLRKFIKSIIPSQGDIFYTLFEEEAVNCYESAKILVDILNAKDNADLDKLCVSAKLLKQRAGDIHKKVLQQLNKVFITPIDRGDIQELSGLFNKLTKRIVKISTKLNIYNIDANTDDCLIKSADTLIIIAQELLECIRGLKVADNDKVVAAGERVNDLEENGIEDFRHAINEIYSGRFDTLTILKLKEIYKSIDSAVDVSVAAADLMMQVSLKNI